MNKLLTSLLVTVSLAVALFANAQETPDYTLSSTNEEIPVWLTLAFDNMPVEEKQEFINFILGRDISPHKDGSNYYDMEFDRDYRNPEVALQDLQNAWSKLKPQERIQKLQKWDTGIQARNKERADQFTPENVKKLREEAERERIERNKEIADTNKKHGLSIPEIPAPDPADLAAADAYTPSVYKELTLRQHFDEATAKSKNRKDEKPVTQEIAAAEKPQSQSLDAPFPQKQGLKAWRKNVASAVIPPEAIEYVNQQNALRAQREKERKAQTVAAEEKPAEEKKGLLAKIFNTPAWQKLQEDMKESFAQSSVKKASDIKGLHFDIDSPFLKKESTQEEAIDPFKGNIAPVRAHRYALKTPQSSFSSAMSVSTLHGGLGNESAQIASVTTNKENPVPLAKPAPGASADNALDKEEIKEKTKQSVIKSYAPWAQELYSVTERVKHTVRTAPKASSTKKMDPPMQQLTKDIRDRLHSHELLKGYYVAVVNVDAVGVEGLTKLHEFLNLKLSDAKAPNAPKEFGKDSLFPYFRMLDKGDRMEIAFTNDIRLRIQANQKKMDLYRLSCENKVCTTDNKQVAGNKNNEATVHIIR